MTQFGNHLREWRNARRMSQLDLALEADVSARHISFLETGRSEPSRPMILHLSDILDIPRERRNDMLEAAGYAAIYQRSPLDSAQMTRLQSAMLTLINQHDPYPAIVKDRLWTIVEMNEMAKGLFGIAGLNKGDNMLEYMAQPGVCAQAIENWGEVGHHVLTRIRNESRALGGVPELDDAVVALSQDPDIAAHSPETPLPPIISTVYRAGDLRLPLFSTFAQFGGAEDLSLTELNIELMFPADEHAEATLRALAGATPEPA